MQQSQKDIGLQFKQSKSIEMTNQTQQQQQSKHLQQEIRDQLLQSPVIIYQKYDRFPLNLVLHVLLVVFTSLVAWSYSSIQQGPSRSQIFSFRQIYMSEQPTNNEITIYNIQALQSNIFNVINNTINLPNLIFSPVDLSRMHVQIEAFYQYPLTFGNGIQTYVYDVNLTEGIQQPFQLNNLTSLKSFLQKINQFTIKIQQILVEYTETNMRQWNISLVYSFSDYGDVFQTLSATSYEYIIQGANNYQQQQQSLIQNEQVQLNFNQDQSVLQLNKSSQQHKGKKKSQNKQQKPSINIKNERISLIEGTSDADKESNSNFNSNSSNPPPENDYGHPSIFIKVGDTVSHMGPIGHFAMVIFPLILILSLLSLHQSWKYVQDMIKLYMETIFKPQIQAILLAQQQQSQQSQMNNNGNNNSNEMDQLDQQQPSNKQILQSQRSLSSQQDIQKSQQLDQSVNQCCKKKDIQYLQTKFATWVFRKKEKKLLKLLKLKTDWRKLTMKQKMLLFDLWFFINIAGSICQVLTSVFGILQTYWPSTNIDISYLIGFSCWLAWINVLRYYDYIEDIHVLTHILRRSGSQIFKFIIGMMPIFMGYVFLGFCMFYKTTLFSSVNRSIIMLFSLTQGDSVFSTFNAINQQGGILGKIYLYSFMIIFMLAVHNIFITIICQKASEREQARKVQRNITKKQKMYKIRELKQQQTQSQQYILKEEDFENQQQIQQQLQIEHGQQQLSFDLNQPQQRKIQSMPHKSLKLGRSTTTTPVIKPKFDLLLGSQVSFKEEKSGEGKQTKAKKTAFEKLQMKKESKLTDIWSKYQKLQQYQAKQKVGGGSPFQEDNVFQMTQIKNKITEMIINETKKLFQLINEMMTDMQSSSQMAQISTKNRIQLKNQYRTYLMEIVDSLQKIKQNI